MGDSVKITRKQLRNIIKESLKESEQMSLDFRPADEREFDAAMESYGEWTEEQIAREDYDYGELDEFLLIKWMASRGRKSGRNYVHLLPAIAADFGFYKGDVMDAIKKHGTKAMAKVMQGYRRR